MADTPKTNPVTTPSPALLDLLRHIQKDPTTKVVLVQDEDAEGGWFRASPEDWDGRETMHTLEDKSYAALQEALELGQEILDRADNNEPINPADLAKLMKRAKALPKLTLVPGSAEVVDIEGDTWDVAPTAKTKVVELLELEFTDEDYRNEVGSAIKVEVDGHGITLAIGCQRRSLALWEREGKRIIREYISSRAELPAEPYFRRSLMNPPRDQYKTAEDYQKACLAVIQAEEKRYAEAKAKYEDALKHLPPTARDQMQFALEQVCAALRARFGVPKATRKRAAKKATKKAARRR